MITALCGGVGGSKLTLGLYRTLPTNSLRVIVNTADDLTFCGLHVSPDLDTVTYTLAGLSRRDVGWGVEGDSFQALSMLTRYGHPSWFQIGDLDMATHLFRTNALQLGKTLTEVTESVAQSLGVQASILPMSNHTVQTRLLVSGQWLEFQEYFVHRRHRDPVEAVRYDGVEEAHPTEAVLTAIDEAESIIIVNSNPVLSITPILLLPGLKERLAAAPGVRVAMSPMIGTDSVSGPAGRLMHLNNLPGSSTGVATMYRDVIHGIVIDHQDAGQADDIRELGIEVHCTDIFMRNDADRDRLARETIAFARSLQ